MLLPFELPVLGQLPCAPDKSPSFGPVNHDARMGLRDGAAASPGPEGCERAMAAASPALSSLATRGPILPRSGP